MPGIITSQGGNHELSLHQQIKPIIADRLPLQAAAHAHELLESSNVRGQLVLLCDHQS
ncbi:hypothetical protein [Calothrix sp. NIES-3974]|uniref:hypothetical protein n=1 Tax=Calothrix sp. NIES-3974 TaxID=2005462 RepID=UPI000B61E96E|nr:hypothetical protein [Calothrix sp. NIES-3974]BAZ07783.1 oxidoreductase, zinc-binding dehydrogenase family protein [Calothrix sp. NIES-3974]